MSLASAVGQSSDNVEERWDEARTFLHEISPNGEGFSNIRYGPKQAAMGVVQPNKNKYWAADDLDNAAAWVVEKADAGYDMYAAIAPRNEESGKKAAIEQCWLVYADVDSPEAHARLEELPTPSFTIASGGAGNMHAYWRLESPVSADGLERITKPLDAYLSGGEQHVFDASHILRIPGTYSFKYNDQRTISYLSDTDQVYEHDHIIEASEEPAKTSTSGKAPSGKRDFSGITREGENRGVKLCQFAGCLKAMGIVGDDALADLLTYNQNHCDPPKDYRTVEQIHRDYVISNETPPDAKEGKGSAIAIPYSEIEPEQVEWLWRECIPRGMITLLGGREGLGKSLLSIQIAAEVSNHGKDVLLLTAEDAPGFTIRPRLTAADADIDRVHDVKLRGTTGDTGLVFPEDGDSLAALVAEHEAELVIVDPLMAHLGGNVNSYNDQSMRAALAPLYQIATDTGTSMLVLCHLNKNASGDALQRFGGTHGIPAAARSALLLAQDPDDEEDGPLRVLAHPKCNVGEKQRSLALEVEPVTLPGGFKTAQIPIRGFSEHQTSALLGPHIADKPTAVDEAEEFLRATLADGPVPVQDVQRAAREAEISDETLKRAKSRLKVESEKTGFKGGWEWSLRRGSRGVDPLGVGDVEPLGESPASTGDFEDASDEEGQCDEVNPLGDFEGAEPFHPQTPKVRLKATDFRHGPDAKFSDEKGRRRPLAAVPSPPYRERQEAKFAELRKMFPKPEQEVRKHA